jgi:hypothetical protein
VLSALLSIGLSSVLSSLCEEGFLCLALTLSYPTLSYPGLSGSSHALIVSPAAQVVAARARESPILTRNMRNVVVAPPYAPNGFSSTIAREQLTKGGSVRYMVPDGVAEYARKHSLY